MRQWGSVAELGGQLHMAGGTWHMYDRRSRAFFRH